MKINKCFTLKAQVSDGRLRGVAAAIGNMDRGGDVIFPGAFQACLEGFLATGFVPLAHRWDELPIAMPVKAQERGRELFTEAVFHSTGPAQDARTVCMERIALGLPVGLSIGFSLEEGDSKGFRSGADLLDFAESRDEAMTELFDGPGIREWKGACRGIMNISELFEYSIVPVPMNPLAVAIEAKDADLGDQDLAGEPLHAEGATFRQHSERVLDAARDLVVRARSIQEMRARHGRTLSQRSIRTLRALQDELSEVISACPKACSLEELRLEAEFHAEWIGALK